MLSYPANTNFEARVTGFPTGLVGQVGVTIRDNTGGVTTPRTTLGIIEDPAGSGSYTAALVTPNVTGQYSIFWDDGLVTPSTVASEDLLVTGGLVPSPVLPGEIMASIDDINANLDDEVVTATADNTALLQISIARIIRGYLSRVVDNATLVSWQTPATTPDWIREAAAKLIAAQLYFNVTSKATTEIPDQHFSQRKYNEAMAMLGQIESGEVTIPDVVLVVTDALSITDFYPVDDTDRAFTLSQRF